MLLFYNLTMSKSQFFELKARQARSNKSDNKIVSLDRNEIFSSTNNKISFRHLHDIYDTKFIPMMMGEGEIVKMEDGKKVLRMHGIKHVKFYQAWDMATPDSNIGKRQIFTMPTDAFLHAINLYDKLIKETIEDNKHDVDHLDYVYKPTCILRTYKKDTEFPSMFVCENIESVMKKNSQHDVECFLEFEISNEGNNGMEPDYDGYSELPKEGERMLMRVNLSAVRYETLNVNRYLSEHHIPAPLVNNPDFPGYRFDRDITNVRRLNTTRREHKDFHPLSFDFLASDKKATVFKLDNGNYGIFMPTIKHVIAYQTWDYELPDGNREKRAVKDISVGHFLSMVKTIHDKHRQLGLSPHKSDFHPTTTIETVDANGNRSIYLGVIRSFSQNVSALRNGTIVFTDPGEEGLYLEISTAQMFDANSNHGVAGLKEGVCEVHLNIDSWWKELLCQIGIGIAIALVMALVPAAGLSLALVEDSAFFGMGVALNTLGEGVLGTLDLVSEVMGTVLDGLSGAFQIGVRGASLGTIDAEQAASMAAQIGKALSVIDSAVANISTLGLQSVFDDGAELLSATILKDSDLTYLQLTRDPETGEVTGGAHLPVKTMEDYGKYRQLQKGLSLDSELISQFQALGIDLSADENTVIVEDKDGNAIGRKVKEQVIQEGIKKIDNLAQLRQMKAVNEQILALESVSKYTDALNQLADGSNIPTFVTQTEGDTGPIIREDGTNIESADENNADVPQNVTEPPVQKKKKVRFADPDEALKKALAPATEKAALSRTSRFYNDFGKYLTAGDVDVRDFERLQQQFGTDKLLYVKGSDDLYFNSNGIAFEKEEFLGISRFRKRFVRDTKLEGDPPIFRDSTGQAYTEKLDADGNPTGRYVKDTNAEPQIDTEFIKKSPNNNGAPIKIRDIEIEYQFPEGIGDGSKYEEFLRLQKGRLEYYVRDRTPNEYFTSEGFRPNTTSLPDDVFQVLQDSYNDIAEDPIAVEQEKNILKNRIAEANKTPNSDVSKQIIARNKERLEYLDYLDEPIEGSSIKDLQLFQKQEVANFRAVQTEANTPLDDFETNLNTRIRSWLTGSKKSGLDFKIDDIQGNLLENEEINQRFMSFLNKPASPPGVNLDDVEEERKTLAGLQSRAGKRIKEFEAKIQDLEKEYETNGIKLSTLKPPSKLTVYRQNLWSSEKYLATVQRLQTQFTAYYNAYSLFQLARKNVDEYLNNQEPSLNTNSKSGILLKNGDGSDTEKELINSYNEKYDSLVKHYNNFYSNMIYFELQNGAKEFFTVNLYNKLSEFTRVLSELENQKAEASSKQAIVIYDWCLTPAFNNYYNEIVNNPNSTDLKSLTPEQNKVRNKLNNETKDLNDKIKLLKQVIPQNYKNSFYLANYYEGNKTVQIWDFKEPTFVYKELSKLLYNGNGITADELVFVNTIDKQEQNVAKYVSLLKDAYEQRGGAANQKILDFCKSTKLIPPHDLYNKNPKEVDFCVAIRGHLVGSDAASNSFVNQLINGKLCRFSFPITKDYYETWEGMHALYKSYKNSEYNQQIKASLALINKVQFILQGLGKGISSKKVLLEGGSNDKLYFADEYQDIGILNYSLDQGHFMNLEPEAEEGKPEFTPDENKAGIYYSYIMQLVYFARTMGKGKWTDSEEGKAIIANTKKEIETFMDFMKKYKITLEGNSALSIARFTLTFSGIVLSMFRSLSNNYHNGQDFVNWITDQQRKSNKDLEKKSKPANECQKAVSDLYQTMTKAFQLHFDLLVSQLYKQKLITATKIADSQEKKQ